MKRILYFLPILLSGCASMYIPSMQNAPLFEEKGETQVEIGVTPNSLQSSVAYSFTDKLYGSADCELSLGNFSDYNDIFTQKSDHFIPSSVTNIQTFPFGRYVHNYVEGGVGTYNLLADSKFRLETSIGGGYGKAKESYEGNYVNKYGLAYVQASFGQRLQFFDWGVSARAASSFHSFEWYDETNILSTTNFTMFHFEPFAFCRVGGKHIKFVGKVGCSLPVGSKIYKDVQDVLDDDYTRTTVLHFSLGIHFSL